MPGDNERAIAKAKTLDCNVVILDLEDAVAPDTKLRARSTAQAAIIDGGFDPREIAIRLNGFGTEWMADDLLAFHQVALDALVIPKAESTEDVFALGEPASGEGASSSAAPAGPAPEPDDPPSRAPSTTPSPAGSARAGGPPGRAGGFEAGRWRWNWRWLNYHRRGLGSVRNVGSRKIAYSRDHSI